MATHKIIDPRVRHAEKPNMTQVMNVAELKTAMQWLMKYIGLK